MELDYARANERLNNPHNLANRFKKDKTSGSSPDEKVVDVDQPTPQPSQETLSINHTELGRPGRPELVPNLPPIVRDTMKIMSSTGMGTQAEIARQFGVSQAEVSAIKTGKVKGVSAETETKLQEIQDLALDRLTKSLLGITDDKLEKTKAKDLASIASSLSKVHVNTSPKTEDTETTKVSVHIYAPEPRKESTYQTIDV